MTERTPPHQRVLNRVQEDDNGCWLTGLRLAPSGLPRITVNGKDVMAHHVLWVHENGPIPEGSDVVQQCRNRQCVRPEHMQLLTHREAMQRTLIKCPPDHERKTRMKQGKLSSYCVTCQRRRERLRARGLGGPTGEAASNGL